MASLCLGIFEPWARANTGRERGLVIRSKVHDQASNVLMDEEEQNISHGEGAGKGTNDQNWGWYWEPAANWAHRD